eukprot:4791867-Alexandrium_andersonii.AAC.1
MSLAPSSSSLVLVAVPTCQQSVSTSRTCFGQIPREAVAVIAPEGVDAQRRASALGQRVA